VVALDAPSPFVDAVASGRAWSGALPPEGPVRALLEQVGPRDARMAAILPIRVGHHTIALIYADAPDGAQLPEIGPFVGFVEEASRKLETALLARRRGPRPQDSTAAC